MDGLVEQGRKTSSVWGKAARIAVIGALFVGFCLVGLVIYSVSQFPSVERLSAIDAKIESWPPYLPNAFIAIEDKRFDSHYGVNLSVSNTLTQQLARALLKGQEHSSWRRVREVGFSVWLELRYSKRQILKYYLDTVYLGAGAYGVEEAAQRYYAKPASELTLAESAVLAGIVKAPSRYAPNLNPDAAQMRAQQVLDAMENQGLASAGLLQEARNNPAKLVR